MFLFVFFTLHFYYFFKGIRQQFSVIKKKTDIALKLKRKGRKDLREGRKIRKCGIKITVFGSGFQEKRIGNGKKESTDYKSALSGFIMYFTHP